MKYSLKNRISSLFHKKSFAVNNCNKSNIEKETWKLDPGDNFFNNSYELSAYQRKNKNILVIGIPGSGRGYHPGDNLKPCSCDTTERPFLMSNKKILYAKSRLTETVFALCPACGLHTTPGCVSEAINDWNRGNVMAADNWDDGEQDQSLFMEPCNGELEKHLWMISGKEFDWKKDYSIIEFKNAIESALKYLSLYESCYFNVKTIDENEINRSLEGLQDMYARLTIESIMKSNYRNAFHNLLRCMDSESQGNRIISVNEYVLYRCIMNCFFMKLEDEVIKY